MKQKDMILLSIAIAIFIGIGVVLFSQTQPKTTASASKTTVETATSIVGGFDDNALSILHSKLDAKDYSVRIDLRSGLGNPKPLGSF